MDIKTYLLYLAAILVLTASPGPSVLLCVTKSIMHGFRASIFAALGSLTAIVGIMTLSFTGLGVLISSSELAFNAVKWVGAGYLVYLGIKTFFSSVDSFKVSENGNASKTYSKANTFVSGFLVGATNPKAIVFFSALFPQFIDMSQALLPQYFLLVMTFAVMELGWLLVYAYFGARSSSWLMGNGRAKLFNRITGGVFVGVGLLLSSSKSPS